MNSIIKKVNEYLENIFGMKLELVPDKSVPQFILINVLDTIEIRYFDKSCEDYLLNGVLLPVLSVLFMLKGKTKEGMLFIVYFIIFIKWKIKELLLKMCVLLLFLG